MKLLPGNAAEYKKRHDALWPELKDLLKGAGIEDYSIFLDEETNVLFGYMRIADASTLDALPANAVMQRWWAFMGDIMETNADNSPVTMSLREVFYMP